MSGGHFDYNQHRINYIIESIEEQIDRNGREYSAEVINEFKIGLEKLKEAYVYAQRIDWLLSGDDGPETFIERLKEDLDKLKSK
jgi:hypothetical protein